MKARDGDYTGAGSAAAHGHTTVALVCETTGALAPGSMRTLTRLNTLAKTTGHRDGTVYGVARSATRSFLAHHLRLIANSIVSTNADLILSAATSLERAAGRA